MSVQNKPQAFEVSNTEARAYWGMGILWIMLATAEDTSGTYSCIEELIPQGEAIFFVEDQPVKATAGLFVSIPRGTKHAFQIDSKTVRLLNTYVPAGFEQMIMATTVPAEARTLPPASMSLPEREQSDRTMEQIFQKYPAAKTNFLSSTLST